MGHEDPRAQHSLMAGAARRGEENEVSQGTVAQGLLGSAPVRRHQLQLVSAVPSG